MDSFYDAPRRPPAPIARETLMAVPVVPEISVLCSSNNAPRNAFTPYNQWKQQQNNFLGPNKENINNCMQQPQNSSILKKQVRFESHVLQKQPPEIVKPEIPCNVLKPQNLNQNNLAPSFEQIYMANIPSRQLDLSVIDFPKKVPQVQNEPIPLQSEPARKEKEPPKTYKEFLENQKVNDIVLNDSVTDIFNYKNSHSSAKTIPKIAEHKQTHTYQTETKELPINNDKHNYFQSVSNAISQRESPNQFQVQNESNDYQKQKVNNDNFILCNLPIYSTNCSPLSQPNSGQIYNSQDLYQELIREELPSSNVERTDMNVPKFEENLKSQKKGDKNNVTYLQKNITESPKKCECCSGSSKALKLKSDDDPSTKDLLKIIAQQNQQISQQNNQILLLQQQVTELISMQNNEIYRQRSTKTSHCCQHDSNGNQKKLIMEQPNEKLLKNVDVQEKCLTSSQREIFNEIEANKIKNQMPNFSIGLTTSFEVSFRRPNNKVNNEQRNPKLLNFEPKIQEITETESTKSDRYGTNKLHNEIDNKETLVDTSIVFKEPIKVREPCPSPEPSININMNDFEESESDEDDSSQVEASFYRNLMAQVNKILQRAQIETAEEFACMSSPKLNNKTIHKVKEATLKHLKRIGIDMPNFEESSGLHSSSSEDIDGRSYTQDDISFAVKQLLMKYLPADHLSKLAVTAKEDAQLTPKEKVGAIKNRPEFSFATVQYMKKYNLIANSQKDFNQPYKETASNKQLPKILDISKLKQQPKLL